MTNLEEEPSQAQRVVAVADAGPGADENAHVVNGDAGNTAPEKGTQDNDHTTPSPSNSSEIVAEPKKEEPQAPPRSKWKTALIMASLMVCSLLCPNEGLLNDSNKVYRLLFS